MIKEFNILQKGTEMISIFVISQGAFLKNQTKEAYLEAIFDRIANPCRQVPKTKLTTKKTRRYCNKSTYHRPAKAIAQNQADAPKCASTHQTRWRAPRGTTNHRPLLAANQDLRKAVERAKDNRTYR